MLFLQTGQYNRPTGDFAADACEPPFGPAVTPDSTEVTAAIQRLRKQ